MRPETRLWQPFFPTCHGPECIAKAVRAWTAAVGARTAHIEPGSPCETGYCKNLNAKLRDVLLRGEIFHSLVEDLASRIPAVLVSEDSQTRRTAIEHEFSARREAAFKELAESALKRSVAIMRTPMRFSLAPMHDGEVLKAEAMAAMAEAYRVRIDADIDATREELEDVLASLPELGREQRETMPTLSKLTGRIDDMSRQGALVTDFTRIRPGALHRANGGFLVLDARRVLAEPFGRDALTRSRETRSIQITAVADRHGLMATTAIAPQPIPLDVRVVLVRDQQLPLLLSELDPDFSQVFRLAAELAELANDLTRDANSTLLFARVLATVGRQEGLCPVARDGVAALKDESSRGAEDQWKLSLRTSEVLV